MATGEGLPSGWLEVLGGLLIALASVVGSGLYFRGKIESEREMLGGRVKAIEEDRLVLLATIENDRKKLLANIEQDRRSLETSCRRQKEEILNELRREVCNVVKQALAEAAIRHTEQIGGISKDLAVIVALHGEMKNDVEAIFARLNRRTSDHPHYPERRDHDQD